VRIDRCAAALLVIGTFVSPLGLRAQTAEYRSALRALHSGRFRDAATLLESSISKKPTSESGYYPYYHLGKAYRCLGDDARAQQYFEQSFILSELEAERDLVQALDRQLSGSPPPCTQIPIQAIPTATSSSSTTTTSAPATTTIPGPAARDVASDVREQLAQNRIQAAVEVLEQSGLPLESPDRAMLEDEIRKTAYERARDGVRKLFRGEPDGAIAQLEDVRGALQDRAMFHLFLAMAYHGAYLYKGENDREIWNKMELEIRSALELDPNVVPDPRLFSPLILEAIAKLRQGS
jgi:tetratricopeptide (TPR) repeat protein